MNGVPPSRGPSGGSGCGAILLILVGVVLLFPGACALYVMVNGINGGPLGDALLFVGLCGIVAIVFGISLLWRQTPPP